MKPVFQHNCEKCTYIGTTHGPDRDWYVHGDTILAREDDEGSEYWSTLISMVDERWMRPIGHFDANPPRESLSTMYLLAYALLERFRENLK